MKLYYSPKILVLTNLPVPLYTEYRVKEMNEFDRGMLQEVDEDAIQRIGKRLCLFNPERSEVSLYPQYFS